MFRRSIITTRSCARCPWKTSPHIKISARSLWQTASYAHLSENLSSFLADTLLPTTDLVLPSAEKKKNVKFFFNPELCDITEDLVLSEPYMSVPYNERNRNIITAGNEEFVDHFLYNDSALHAEVAKLRDSFMNNAQALIHGDLHSGSVFANENGIKVIDPEFAFYGPMGYDIGNVIGNFFFSLASKIFTMPEETDAINALYRIIAETYDMTREKLLAKYDELVSFPALQGRGLQKALHRQRHGRLSRLCWHRDYPSCGRRFEGHGGHIRH